MNNTYPKALSNINMDKNSVEKLSNSNNEVESKTETHKITDKVQLHNNVLECIHSLYVKKNHDYGDSVHDTYKKYGLVSFLVRMEDKLNRVRILSLKKENEKINDAKVTDEKIEDTLLDLANYTILAFMELYLDKKTEE